MDETRVLGDKDWLKNLSFGVKNIANKSIIAFDLAIYIKKHGDMPTGVSFPIYFRTYTKDSGNNARTAGGVVKLGSLQPGETIKVKISDRDFKMFADVLARNGVDDIDRVILEIRGVYFDDETRWMFGQESRPDTNHPGSRIPVTEGIPRSGPFFRS